MFHDIIYANTYEDIISGPIYVFFWCNTSVARTSSFNTDSKQNHNSTANNYIFIYVHSIHVCTYVGKLIIYKEVVNILTWKYRLQPIR